MRSRSRAWWSSYAKQAIDFPPSVIAVVVATSAAVVALELASHHFAAFFADRSLESGFLSGSLLTLVVAIVVQRVLSGARESKWEAIRIAGFESLAHQVTHVIDLLNWSVAGHLP